MRKIIGFVLVMIMFLASSGCIWWHEREGRGHEGDGYGDHDRDGRGDHDRDGRGDHDRH